MVAIPQNLLSPTVTAMDAASEATQEARQQRRLSGGLVGDPCERAIWYVFHWVREPEHFSGRMIRLFGTGHREESRLVEALRAAGVDVSDVDPATGEQHEVAALDGHFVGKLDGKASGVIEAPKALHVLEIKTHNDKSFQQLKKHGVAASKPKHEAQMQVYMRLSGIERALYLAKNKNDDELYVERIHHDAARSLALMVKAERILDAARPPAKIADDPGAFSCRFCPSKGVCHEGAFALRNCRTCLHSTAARGGNALWTCALHDRPLSIDDQLAGCGQHLFIPDLVPGEQMDVSADGSAVTYLMPDGSEWIDGGRA